MYYSPQDRCLSEWVDVLCFCNIESLLILAILCNDCTGISIFHPSCFYNHEKKSWIWWSVSVVGFAACRCIEMSHRLKCSLWSHSLNVSQWTRRDWGMNSTTTLLSYHSLWLVTMCGTKHQSWCPVIIKTLTIALCSDVLPTPPG